MFLLTIDIPDEPPIVLPPDLSVLIGRGDLCDVQLKDPTLSRAHCRIVAQNGTVTLYDAGSRWGTFVNDHRITECQLKPGDRIRVGETTLTLRLHSSSKYSTVAPHTRFAEDQTSVVAQTPWQEIPKQEFTANDFLGKTFHRYQVKRLIAETAYGIVFYAEMLKDRSAVALKIFRPTFFESETEEQRFTRAVTTMFEKKHCNIVELLNAGRWNGWFFTASEYVEGVSALELIQQIGILGMLSPDKVVQIALDLCEALRFAEQNRIVHRNISPSNILIRRTDGTTLLNDLILARGIDTSNAARLTTPGEVLGDVRHMSPEQLGSGHLLDHRSDIYQLGVTLYVLLAGRPPFEGGTVTNTITQVLTVTPESTRSRNISIPDQLDTVVLRMLARNPRDRYQSAEELAVALKRVERETSQFLLRSNDANPRATGWKGALDGLL